eukprot:GHVL01003777.1.p1 GENE.GHVL01003777.1~~GHVL01003777.1.p1  ORF type:complete len:406 (+),score=87.11 GHVL01003777.1:511-1728(+)
MMIEEPVDVMISHDWPTGVCQHGDVEKLLRDKPFFADDIAKNALGNPHTEVLLHKMQPDYWFSGHLHVKFCAKILHKNDKSTHFMALDKCMPRRQFLEILDINPTNENEDNVCLQYDEEWLSIVKANHRNMPLGPYNQQQSVNKPSIQVQSYINHQIKRYGSKIPISDHKNSINQQKYFLNLINEENIFSDDFKAAVTFKRKEEFSDNSAKDVIVDEPPPSTLPLQIGEAVRIVGLINSEKYNNCYGIIQSDDKSDRYEVDIVGQVWEEGKHVKRLQIKRTNLIPQAFAQTQSTLELNMLVRINGLKNQTKYNCRPAVIIQSAIENVESAIKDFTVQLLDEEGKQLKLKSENLFPVAKVDNGDKGIWKKTILTENEAKSVTDWFLNNDDEVTPKKIKKFQEDLDI